VFTAETKTARVWPEMSYRLLATTIRVLFRLERVRSTQYNRKQGNNIF